MLNALLQTQCMYNILWQLHSTRHILTHSIINILSASFVQVLDVQVNSVFLDLKSYYYFSKIRLE